MVFKIILRITGEYFTPDSILDKLNGQFIISSRNNPKDKKFENREDKYGFGSISFFHPKKFATEESISIYNEWQIKFLKNNYGVFVEGGADSFQYFIEIYYEGDQCNFEIFSPNELGEISNIRISLPVSVYKFSHVELGKWEEEIRKDWESGTFIA
jgi:hypothetical protein